MIHGYEKLCLPDLHNKNDIIIEVNFDNKPETLDCQVIKVTLGKTVRYVKRDHLMAILMVVGRPEDQRDLIPIATTMIRKYQTMLGITATKDIKKGEKINVVVDIPLPPIEQEVIQAAKKLNPAAIAKGNGKATKSKSGLWLPKA